jgi:hypothetical protein
LPALLHFTCPLLIGFPRQLGAFMLDCRAVTLVVQTFDGWLPVILQIAAVM